MWARLLNNLAHSIYICIQFENMTPLIDRMIFFGNPQIMGGKISPNGQSISFIKPYNGMLNIWVKDKSEPFDAARVVTNDQSRPITSYFWTRDSKYIIYVQDKGGDENYHVYALDPYDDSGEFPLCRDLTDYGSIRAMILALPKNNHDEILVGLNDRDAAWHDLYRISISSGERTLLYQNQDNLSSYYFDNDYNLIMASRSTADAGIELLYRNSDKWNSIIASSGDEYISPLKFIRDDEYYVESNIGNEDLSFLGILNLRTGGLQKNESDPDNNVDFGGAIFSDRTNELIATVYNFKKAELYWKDQDYKEDYNFLKDKFDQAEISLLSSTTNEREWIVNANSDTDPGAAYYFNRDSKEVTFLYRPRPELPIEHLCPMRPIEYKGVDGLEIHGYITIPTSNAERLPGIIMPHGGPWVRDNWGYNSYAQFLANRGYVVLQVNYRGSTGYGKSFLNAGDKEWGMKMQDDLTKGVQYLIEHENCDRDKIGILGGSYGGYATLAGLTFTPEIYACGVSIVGPSNLFTLLESIPAYWETARAMFHKRMGDPSTEEGKKRLRAQSPFFHASKIQAPLLVGQGDNDPRVKTAESEQIVSAMKKHQLKVTYLNFPDEGHGFANPLNNMAFTVVMEQFLAKHLGGRCQEEVPEMLQEIIDRVTIEPL